MQNKIEIHFANFNLLLTTLYEIQYFRDIEEILIH